MFNFSTLRQLMVIYFTLIIKCEYLFLFLHYNLWNNCLIEYEALRGKPLTSFLI